MYNDLIAKYIFFFGIFVFCLGFAELFFSEKTYMLWKKFINSKFYFFYGILLIIFGFPLTLYHGKFSTLIFVIGMIIVLTGPFILIYPEKMKKIYAQTEDEFGEEEMDRVIFFDAIIRIAIGILFIVSQIHIN